MAQDKTIKNYMHGQKISMRFLDDPNWYYSGRASVGEWEYYRGAGRLRIALDAKPYKSKWSQTTVSGSGALTLTNDRMPVSPKISCSSPVTLTWGSYSVSLSAGNNQSVPQLVLKEGDNVITSSGQVSFTWREGSL